MKSIKNLILATLFIGTVGQAQTYKCTINGNTSYNQTPCPAGAQQSILNIADARTVQQVKEAQQRAAQDKAHVEKFEKERQKQEEKIAKENQKVAAHNAKVKKQCESLERKLKWAKEDAESATAKHHAKEQKKLERAREKFAAECATF